MLPNDDFHSVIVYIHRGPEIHSVLAVGNSLYGLGASIRERILENSVPTPDKISASPVSLGANATMDMSIDAFNTIMEKMLDDLNAIFEFANV